MSTDRARYDAASSLVRLQSPRQAFPTSCAPALKEPPVKVSIPPDRIPLGRQQQAFVPRQRPRAEHRGEVSAALALRDLPLRISMAVAGLLLAVRAPLPGLAPSGQYAVFHTPSARPQPVRPWAEFTVAGGLA